jgi:hypothetical protein
MFASIIAFLYIVKQLLLDVAAMLVGNITVVLNDVITLMASLAGMIWDIEALLEKIIVLLKS